MRIIHTLTVMYDEREDRLNLAARCSDGAEQGLWLTQRLGNQLVKVLAARAREQAAEAARQAAARPAAGPRASRGPEPAADDTAPAPRAAEAEVVPVELEGGSPHGLVHTINIVRHDSGLTHLIFRWDDEGAAMLPLDPAALERVVDILRLRYRTAGWPLDNEWTHARAQWDTDASVPPNTTLH